MKGNPVERRLVDLFVAWLSAIAVLAAAGAGIAVWAAVDTTQGWRIVAGVLAALGAATPAFAIIAIVTLLASIDARLAEAPSGGGEEAEEGPPPDGLCRGRPDG